MDGRRSDESRSSNESGGAGDKRGPYLYPLSEADSSPVPTGYSIRSEPVSSPIVSPAATTTPNSAAIGTVPTQVSTASDDSQINSSADLDTLGPLLEEKCSVASKPKTAGRRTGPAHNTRAKKPLTTLAPLFAESEKKVEPVIEKSVARDRRTGIYTRTRSQTVLAEAHDAAGTSNSEVVTERKTYFNDRPRRAKMADVEEMAVKKSKKAKGEAEDATD